LPAARRLLFQTVSQTLVNYRSSQLSEGRTERIHGGDRLPWLGRYLTDNFAPLSSLDWQVHVYGDAPPEVRAVCTQHMLPLHVFSWRQEFSRAGVPRDAIYLVRPDGYVGLATRQGGASAIASYLAARKLALAKRE
jgi:hypothetical protein